MCNAIFSIYRSEPKEAKSDDASRKDHSVPISKDYSIHKLQKRSLHIIKQFNCGMIQFSSGNIGVFEKIHRPLLNCDGFF